MGEESRWRTDRCSGRVASLSLDGGVLYRWLVRPILYLLSAETAHRLVAACLRLLQAFPWIWVRRRADEVARVRALGLEFPSPVGLAAGFDKDAEMFEALGLLGFGFVEVGTITGEPQPGNPRPRLFRLPADRALINRMGFNNHGAEAAARRLAGAKKRRTVLGINIGKTKVVPAEQAAADYAKSARLLGRFADYLVINVSSPNTPGLRDLQAVESLRPLIAAVRSALDQAVPDRRIPLLVKIAPDLEDDDIRAVADLALELGIEGIIATNTTIRREGLASPESAVTACGAGGLSGAPLKARSLAVLRLLRERVGSRLTLISVGGIETADDAWERLRAGATLIQIYSALVYDGPSLPQRLTRGLLERARQEGFSSLQAVLDASSA